MTLVLQSLARSFMKRSSTSLMVGKSLPTPRKWPMQEKVYSSPVSSRVIVLHHLILVSVVWISGLQIVLPKVLLIWLCDSVMAGAGARTPKHLRLFHLNKKRTPTQNTARARITIVGLRIIMVGFQIVIVGVRIIIARVSFIFSKEVTRITFFSLSHFQITQEMKKLRPNTIQRQSLARRARGQSS
ncbi:hypothetical protein YC2023_022743 [Brassica napus]